MSEEKNAVKTRIYAALVEVMEAVGHVGKGGKAHASVGGYAFRGIDDVMAALQPALIKAGVVCTPEMLDLKLSEYKTSKGSIMQHAIVKACYTFWADDGSSVSATVYGEGADAGDKAVNKAMAGAMKYAVTQALSIPTSEPKDSEADPQASAEGRAAREPAKPPARTKRVTEIIEEATQCSLVEELGNLMDRVAQMGLSEEEKKQLRPPMKQIHDRLVAERDTMQASPEEIPF